MNKNVGARRAVPLQGEMMTSLEMREQMMERRRARYYQGRAWHWTAPNKMVQVGVIEAYPGAWIVGWLSESGGGHKLNSSALSKHQLNKDPDFLLKVVTEWAYSRKLKEVTL